jgi:single-strand DNA-binding protein
MQGWFGNGNLTADPELKHVGAQKSPLTKFTVAINEGRKNAAGEWENVATFVRCEAWNSVAERIVARAAKGDGVLVYGRLKNNKWTAEDGTPRNETFVSVERFDVVRPKSGKPSPDNSPPSEEENSAPAEAPAEEPKSGEEIPF